MEVDGKRTENGTELCVPCLTDGVTTEPDGFCKDCEEFMCQQCFKYHLKVKSCRNHSNTDDGQTPAQQLTQGEVCSKHINETVKFYCRKHDLVGCGDCMIPDHGTCKPEVIREIVTHFEQPLEFKGMLRQVDQCDIDLTESESHIEQNRRENKNMISDALNEIRKFRTDINNYYDRVETEIVTEANNVAKENEELMSQLEVKILSFRQEMAEIKETLDTSRITAENLFIRVIENKRKFYQIEKLVAELKMKNNLKVFKFEPEQRVKALQSSGVKLGNLTMSIHKYHPSANSGDSKNSSKETTINENTTKTTTMTESPDKHNAVLQKISMVDVANSNGGCRSDRHYPDLENLNISDSSVKQFETQRELSMRCRGSGSSQSERRGHGRRSPNRRVVEAESISALSRPESSRRYGDVSPPRYYSRGRSIQPQESERERAVAAAKTISASQSDYGGNRERSNQQQRQASPVRPPSSELTLRNMGVRASTTLTAWLLLKDIETKLNDLIVEKKADNEKVFDWIKSNVDEPTTKQPKFIRALMTAVCNSAIKGEKGKKRLEPKEISKRNDLLQKYLDCKAESELQALYALQALITKLGHPQGILRGMFDTLYDEDLISEDAVFQWEKSEEEPEGKGSCLKQAVQFFTWLREDNDDA